MPAFTDSRSLLGDGGRLRERFANDGYLFLRNQVPPSLLVALRRQIIEICARHGWIPGIDPLADAHCDHHPVVEGEEAYFAVYDEVQRLEGLHALAHEEAVLAPMRALLGDTAFPHPLSICRLVFPHNQDWSTPPHQDFPNNQGTPDLYACWIPLGDCPRKLGSLAILAGSHKLGLLPLKFALGAGHRQCVLDPRHDALEWVSADFMAGDMLIFHSHTVHRALPNVTDRIRLSVDYRCQREGEPLTAQSLLPHFNRLSWEDVYEGWQGERLKYYWRDKRYSLAAWDDSLHALPPEDWDEAVRVRIAYDRRIAALAKRSPSDPSEQAGAEP